jgi:hypothetical protein
MAGIEQFFVNPLDEPGFSDFAFEPTASTGFILSKPAQGPEM